MAIKKHLLETYRNYKIFAVSGITPPLFIAEKDNPAKGSTLTNDNIDDLRMDVDKLLGFAKEIKINTYEGPEIFQVLQNPKTVIKSVASQFDGLAIVIESNYDLDFIIEMVESRPVRRSKKHIKNRKFPLSIIKLIARNRSY